MRTFKQFLGEAEAPQDARAFFEKESHPFIEKADGAGVFLRALKHEPTHYATITLPSGREVSVGRDPVSKDRKPVDLDSRIHTVTDEWMDWKFGIRGRSQTAFVVGDAAIRQIQHYGQVYIAVPQGEFKFLWSSESADLLAYANANDLDERIEGKSDEEAGTIIRSDLNRANYRAIQLPRAIRSWNEIMVECDHMLMIKMEDEDMLKEIKAVLK
ncbi:hypothetical protein [Janthinobacterium sp.]|uniref:hypothetical protein n=1 Tax=Janthinobacterium sp. TaxID=1871054 RepID=UPI002626A373|nr:hypothetical protein [Janthinobacterium sp.]